MSPPSILLSSKWQFGTNAGPMCILLFVWRRIFQLLIKSQLILRFFAFWQQQQQLPSAPSVFRDWTYWQAWNGRPHTKAVNLNIGTTVNRYHAIIDCFVMLSLLSVTTKYIPTCQSGTKDSECCSCLPSSCLFIWSCGKKLALTTTFPPVSLSGAHEYHLHFCTIQF